MTAAHIAAVLFLACAWMLAAILVALVVGPLLRRRVDDYTAEDTAANDAAWEEAVALGNSHGDALDHLAAYEASRADWREPGRWGV